MILGIDLGQKTTGLAISQGQIATPFKTIIHKDQNEALRKILEICDREEINKIILGYVEGKIKKLFTNFALKLEENRPQFEVILRDETLTSGQASKTMIKLQIPKLKRRQKEHEVAAAIILQSYLDEINL